MNYLDRQRIVPMALLACALHEFAHIAAIRRSGAGIKEINITFVGAEIVCESTLGYWRDGIAALAGPGINLMLALLFSHIHWGMMFAGLNLVLACFNLLPIGMLDGGRALRATLCLLMDPERARVVSMVLDGFFICAILFVGTILLFRYGNGMLLLIGCWMLSSLLRAKEGN